MVLYLILLVASVFLGTELLALPTPAFQLTLYRVLSLSVLPILLISFLRKDKKIKMSRNSAASFAILTYLAWYLWAWISGMWALDMTGWMQTIFLMTIGISSLSAIYFWVNDEKTWYKLVKTAWWMMTLLAFLGLYEIITNDYFFADMAKLDKYRTFAREPWTRMPITHFSNQNDYATMLLAYLPLSFILYYKESRGFKRSLYLAAVVLGFFLIYMTRSRMSLLAALIYLFLIFLFRFQVDIKRSRIYKFLAAGVILAVLSVLFVPPVQAVLDQLIYTNNTDILTGDTGRVNLLRNGLYFLGATLGFGVGAGNIEYWMTHFRFLPTQNIVNMHMWWGEILVGYGIVIFTLYVIMYGLLIYRLTVMRSRLKGRERRIIEQLLAFLIIYILASMTSANNMLIEWHWVFFGLIISFIKLLERKYLLNQKNYNYKGENHELNNSF